MASSNKTNGSKPMRSLQHHKDYYMIGGDLYLLIDSTVFKIHSYFFAREAKNFYNKLIDPVSPGEEPQGKSEQTAIIIENATIADLERFLWVFYNPYYDIYKAPIEDWFTILRLAHEWGFANVKQFALREIKRRENEIPLVERIVLYQTYKAPPALLVPLFAELAARPAPLSGQEMGTLGSDQSLKVFIARDQLRSPGGLSPLPKGITPTETFHAISAVMGLPQCNPDEFIVAIDVPVNGTVTKDPVERAATPPTIKEPQPNKNTGRPSGSRRGFGQ